RRGTAKSTGLPGSAGPAATILPAARTLRAGGRRGAPREAGGPFAPTPNVGSRGPPGRRGGAFHPPRPRREGHPPPGRGARGGVGAREGLPNREPNHMGNSSPEQWFFGTNGNRKSRNEGPALSPPRWGREGVIPAAHLTARSRQ